MPTVTFPYETLKRLKLVSLSPLVLELAGQHVKFRTIVTNDTGAVVSDMESEAKAVSVGESAGLKLDDFEPAFHAAALRAIDQHATEVVTAAREKAAELAAKDAEIAAKTAEIAAENAVALAAKALAAKISEVAEVEKDDPERAAKEVEAARLAEVVETKEAELAIIKLPKKEKDNQKLRDEIARLQAELSRNK